MLRLIILLCLLIASVWLGLIILKHPGFLLIIAKPWTIQMPIWFAVLTLLAIFLIFFVLINSIDYLHFLWFKFKSYLQFRKQTKSYSKTQHGLSMLIEERWSKAERLLLAGLSQTVEPLMNYLGAAKAAHAQSAYERRDHYLQKAYQSSPTAELAIGLTQADLQIDKEQFEQATATLTRLKQTHPRHPRILKSLEKIYIRLSDFKNLQTLLPDLYKAKLLNAEQFELFTKNIYCELLKTETGNTLQQLHTYWAEIPRSIRKNPDVVCAYVKRLLAIGANEEVESLIRQVLKANWHAELVTIYGQLNFTQLDKQLVIVGAWLKLHGEHPELFLTLGRLCKRLRLWGKAKDYFERCLSFGANPTATLEFGRLYEELGEPEAALLKYKEELILQQEKYHG